MVAIVFDMDGTLIDSAMIVPTAFISTLAELGVSIDSREEIVEAYPIGPPQAIIGHFLNRPATLEDLKVYHGYLEKSASDLQVYDGVRELLEELRLNYRLAVFTGASTQAAKIMLLSVGLIKVFETIVGADQVDRPKPHPGGLIRTFSAMGLDPSDGFYVGDAVSDIEAAQRAGAKPIVAGWGHLFEFQQHVPIATWPSDVVRIVNCPP